jgi:uncharacterized protein involved in tellurium resistance
MPSVEAVDNTPLNMQAMGNQVHADSVQSSLSRALDRIDPATKIANLDVLKKEYKEIYDILMMTFINEARREAQKQNDHLIAEMKKQRSN